MTLFPTLLPLYHLRVGSAYHCFTSLHGWPSYSCPVILDAMHIVKLRRWQKTNQRSKFSTDNIQALSMMAHQLNA